MNESRRGFFGTLCAAAAAIFAPVLPAKAKAYVSRFRLEAVGRDDDGKIKPIDQLNYSHVLRPLWPYRCMGLVRMESRPDGRVIGFVGRGWAFLLPQEFTLNRHDPFLVNFDVEECFGLTLQFYHGDGERRLMESIRGVGMSEGKVLSWKMGFETVRDAAANRDVPLAEWNFKPIDPSASQYHGISPVKPDGPIASTDWS